jgi:hypothetical protein
MGIKKKNCSAWTKLRHKKLNCVSILPLVPAFFINSGILTDVEWHLPLAVGQALLPLHSKFYTVDITIILLKARNIYALSSS